MSKIEGQTLALKHGEITFGIQIEHQDGAPPTINLFELSAAENAGHSLIDNLPTVIKSIHEQRFAEKDISSLNWSLTRNGTKERLYLDGEQNLAAVGVPNRLISGNESDYSITYYLAQEPVAPTEGQAYYKVSDLENLSNEDISKWLSTMSAEQKVDVLGVVAGPGNGAALQRLLGVMEFDRGLLRAIATEVVGSGASFDPNQFPALKDHHYSIIDPNDHRSYSHGHEVYIPNRRLVANISDTVEALHHLTGQTHFDVDIYGSGLAVSMALSEQADGVGPVVKMSESSFHGFINAIRDIEDAENSSGLLGSHLQFAQKELLKKALPALKKQNSSNTHLNPDDMYTLNIAASELREADIDIRIPLNELSKALHLDLFDYEIQQKLTQIFLNNAEKNWVAQYQDARSNWEAMSEAEKLEFGKLHLAVLGELYDIDAPPLFAQNINSDMWGQHVSRPNQLAGEIRINNNPEYNTFLRSFDGFMNTLSHEFGHEYTRQLSFSVSEYARSHLSAEDRAKVPVITPSDSRYRLASLVASNNKYTHPNGVYYNSKNYGFYAYRTQPDEAHAFRFGASLSSEINAAIDSLDLAASQDAQIAYLSKLTVEFTDIMNGLDLKDLDPEDHAKLAFSFAKYNGAVSDLNLMLEKGKANVDPQSVRVSERSVAVQAAFHAINLREHTTDIVKNDVLSDLTSKLLRFVNTIDTISNPNPEFFYDFTPQPQADEPDKTLTDVRVGGEQSKNQELKDSHRNTPKPINLALPSDAEISRMLGGIPVTSLKPEDLPHFRPSLYEGYNAAEIDGRIQTAHDRITSFNPAWDGGHSDLGMIGTSKSAAVMTWYMNGDPNMFVLLRPSDQMDQKNSLSNAARVRPEDISYAIPKQATDFINTYHEIGHMHANTYLGGYDWSPLEKEMHADSFGLQKYLDAGGDIEVVRAYIQKRALSSFLNQAGAYRIAPILEERFLSKDAPAFSQRYDDQNVHYKEPDLLLKSYQGYGELIARVSDRVAGYNALSDYSSADIQQAILLSDQNRFDEIPNKNLIHALKNAEEFKRNTESDFNQNRRAVFDAVHDIITSENIDPHTVRAGQRVLEAAEKFTPNLLSEKVATYRQMPVGAGDETQRKTTLQSETLSENIDKGSVNRTQQNMTGTKPSIGSHLGDLNTKFNGASIVGANGVGVGMGTMAIINSNGDAGLIAIGSGDIVTSSADMALDIAQARGATVSTGLLKNVMKANIALTVIDIGYQVYKEDGNFIDEDGGIGHKGERLVAGTMTAGVGLGTGVLLGGSGFLGAAAGGTVIVGAAAVAAPVVVVGTAVVATGVVTERAIEVRRIHESTNELIDEMTEAEKYRASDRPSIADYKQCMFSSMRFSDMMRDDVLVGDIERNSQHDGYRITNLDEIDWTNPANIAEFERMLDLALKEQIRIEDEHDGWFVSAKRNSLWNDARTNIKMLKSAKEEIEQFKGELSDWQNRQTDNGIGPKGQLGNAWANAGKEEGQINDASASTPTNTPAWKV